MPKDRKIEQPEAHEILVHGRRADGFEDASDHFDAVNTHVDEDMDASWRLRQDHDPESLSEGTMSEGLARVALREQKEKERFKNSYRRVKSLIGDLSEEEMWEVLQFGDTVGDMEKSGRMTTEQAAAQRERYRMLKEDADKAKPKTESELEAMEQERLAELKRKYEDDTEARERAELQRLKEKYEK